MSIWTVNADARSTQTATTTAGHRLGSTWSTYNQTLTFTATVKASSRHGDADRQRQDVLRRDDRDQPRLGYAPGRRRHGQGDLTTATLPLGAQTITASYGGVSGTFGSSTNTTPLSVTVTVTSIAAAYVLDPTAAGALTLSGNAQLQLAGLVDVDSSSTSAINASGNAIVSGSAIQVHGKVLSSGKAQI